MDPNPDELDSANREIVLPCVRTGKIFNYAGQRVRDPAHEQLTSSSGKCL